MTQKTKKSQSESRLLSAVAYSGESGQPRWDIMSPAKRSSLMARIRCKDTGPEISVRRLLHAMGYRFRLHARDLPGRPDIVFRSRRTVIFVHGCFWHRHHCGLAYTPKTRREFWQRKFDGNVMRDARARDELEAAGWRVIVVWECQLDNLSAVAVRLAKSLAPVGRVRKSGHPIVSVPRRRTTEQTPVRATASRPQRQHGRSP